VEPRRTATGTTDIPLTGNGRQLAERLQPVPAKGGVYDLLCSPVRRARETRESAGLAVIDPDLAERNYGEYERLTTKQIHEMPSGWLLFRDGCPGGEKPEQVGARMDRVIARARAANGDTALFAHARLDRPAQHLRRHRNGLGQLRRFGHPAARGTIAHT
jgi:broad specificity phosphatase PhoE